MVVDACLNEVEKYIVFLLSSGLSVTMNSAMAKEKGEDRVQTKVFSEAMCLTAPGML